MNSDVVKAGVLEVTVVQAVGVGLHGSGTAFTRGRRKPAILARVTVDGSTQSGSPAPRSHHPVWFPARRPPIEENAISTASSRVPNHAARGGGRGGNASLAAGEFALDREGTAGLAVGRASMRDSQLELGDGTRGEQFDRMGMSLLDRTAGRYSIGGGGGGGGGLSAGAAGGGADVSSGGGGYGNNRGSLARGLLFEVREFYGPCRIEVELVSGGGGGGSGGSGAGGGSGGTVLGRCEARLAEALVGRGGSVVSGSGSLVKGTPAGLGSKTSKDVQLAPKEIIATAAPFSAVPEITRTLAWVETPGNSNNNADTPIDPGGPRVELPSSIATTAASATGAGSVIRNTGDAAPNNPAAPPAQRKSSCFPGSNVFGRWRRRGALVSENTPSGSAPNHGGEAPRGADGDSIAPSSSAVRGTRSGKNQRRASTGSISRSSRWTSSGRMGWGRGAAPTGEKNFHSSVASSSNRSRSWTSGKDLIKMAASSSSTLSMEEAEKLALSNWGGCRGSSGGIGAARDVWKELSSATGDGKNATGGGGGGASGAVSAVRLRLRFVPIWDCLEGAGGGAGLGALHASARDGDSLMVISLLKLWDQFSPKVRPLTLKCRRGLTPVQHCIEGGNESALRELLRTTYGRSYLQGVGKEGEDTALHTAIKAGQESMLKFILSMRKRAEAPTRVLNALTFGLGSSSNTFVDLPGADGLSPLALAALYGNDAMVKYLLDEGADASKSDARGMTPLAHAAQGGKLHVVRVLLKSKAAGTSGVPGLRRSRLAKMACSPCKANKDGMGPLALAAASGAHQVVAELIRADVPYRTRDRQGRTPLHHAAAGGHIAVLRVIVAEMRKGKGNSVAGPGGAVGPIGPSTTVGVMGGGGGEGDVVGIHGEKNITDESMIVRDHSLMMDGGPFKIGNLDLAGRSAHATALLNNNSQAAIFLEAAAGELEFRHSKESTVSSRRRPWSGGGAGKAGQIGQFPRATNASSKQKSESAQGSGSGSGSGAWSGSGSGSGTPCKPSPMSSIGIDSGGSLVESEDLSYEYVESDRDE